MAGMWAHNPQKFVYLPKVYIYVYIHRGRARVSLFMTCRYQYSSKGCKNLDCVCIPRRDLKILNVFVWLLDFGYSSKSVLTLLLIASTYLGINC